MKTTKPIQFHTCLLVIGTEHEYISAILIGSACVASHSSEVGGIPSRINKQQGKEGSPIIYPAPYSEQDI